MRKTGVDLLVALGALFLCATIVSCSSYAGNNQYRGDLGKATDITLCNLLFSNGTEQNLRSEISKRNLLSPDDIANLNENKPQYPVIGMKACYLSYFHGVVLPDEGSLEDGHVYDYKPCEHGGLLDLFGKDVCRNLAITVQDRVVTDIKCNSGLPERCHSGGYLSQEDEHKISNSNNYAKVNVSLAKDYSFNTSQIDAESGKYFQTQKTEYPDRNWVLTRAIEISKPLFNRFFGVSPVDATGKALEANLESSTYSVSSNGSINCATMTVIVSINGLNVSGQSGCDVSYDNVIDPEIITRLQHQQGAYAVQTYMNSLYSIAVNRALLDALSRAFAKAQ